MVDMFNSSENGSGLILDSLLLQPEGEKDSKIWQILKATCLFLVNHGVWITVVLGCLGNGLCLVVFARRKHVKPNDVFIITLAALDFTFCTANAVYYHMRSDVVVKTDLDCAMENSFYHFLIPATCLTLMAITVDRYFAVFKIMEHRAHVSNRKCLLCVAGIMGVTVVAVIPISFGCFMAANMWMISYMYFVNLTLIMMAAVVILYVYCRIYFTVRQYDVLRQQMMSGQVTMETGAGTQAHGQTTSNQEIIEMLPVIAHKGSGRCSTHGDNYQRRCKQQMRNIVSPNVPYGCMPIRNVSDSPAGIKFDNMPAVEYEAIEPSRLNAEIVFLADGTGGKDEIVEANFNAVTKKGCSITPVIDTSNRKLRPKRCNSQRSGSQPQSEGADKRVMDLQRNIKRETKTTRVCVLVSFFFIVFCLPSAVIQVVWQVTPENDNEDSFHNSTHFFLLLKLFYTLSTFNAIVNPLIYSISSARFKKELTAMYNDVTDAIAKGLRRFSCLH